MAWAGSPRGAQTVPGFIFCHTAQWCSMSIMSGPGRHEFPKYLLKSPVKEPILLRDFELFEMCSFQLSFAGSLRAAVWETACYGTPRLWIELPLQRT